MPAIMEDPARPVIHRRSGAAPFPDPALPSIPDDVVPRQVTLRDRQTTAVIYPFASSRQLPISLLAYLCDQFNKEIEGGDTYPMMDLFTTESFADYWFQSFAAVMLLGNIADPHALVEGKDWSRECLGSFYIKPNYPGRSSHVCNAGFLVTEASRNRGVGRLMGEAYIDWAPRLKYTYSVFNLVYETNVASCRIWDALGFKRIGRVKGCGNLKSYPDRLIDAIIYGRDLVPGESEELVSEERFDKIKFYLKYGKYPDGADRAEKSRLRSAATHYKLLEGDKLMLKDKEVISDPAKQYEISRHVHVQQHGGINKTTATIAEKYHWSRIKETVSDVIRNCTECKDVGNTPNLGGSRRNPAVVTAVMGVTAAAPTVVPMTTLGNSNGDGIGPLDTADLRDDSALLDAQDILTLRDHTHDMMPTFHTSDAVTDPTFADPHDLSSIAPSHTLHDSTELHGLHHHHHHHHYPPIIDRQILDQPPTFDQYHVRDFQALLNATEDDMVIVRGDGGEADVMSHHHHHHHHHEQQHHNGETMDKDDDLDMLIEHQEEGEDDVVVVMNGNDEVQDMSETNGSSLLLDKEMAKSRELLWD